MSSPNPRPNILQIVFAYIKDVSRLDSTKVIILFLLAVVLFTFKLADRDFWGTPEARSAQIAKEMLQTDQWLIPHYNGEVKLTKPPLFFWTIALVSALFGGEVTEFTARLLSALSGVVVVLATFFIGKRLLGVRTGFIGGLVLIANLKFLWQAQQAQLDMMLTAFVTLAMLSFIYGYSSPKRKSVWYICFYLCIGLAVMTKGPVGIVLPGSTLLLYAVFQREMKLFREIRLLWGILVVGAVLLPWSLFIYLNVEGVQQILLKETVARFIQPADHIRALWYYLPQTLLCFLPWTIFFPSAFWEVFRSEGDVAKQKAKMLLFLWFIGNFVIFSLSGSKQSHYLIPLYPALALLVGSVWDAYRSGRRKNVNTLNVEIGIFIIVLASVIGALGLLGGTRLFFEEYHKGAVMVAVPLLAGALATALFFRVRRPAYALETLLATIMIGSLLGLYYIMPVKNTDESPVELCHAVKNTVGPDMELRSYGYSKAYILFYTDRLIPCLKDEEEVMQYLGSERKKFLIMRERDYNTIKTARSRGITCTTVLCEERKGKQILLITNREGEDA